MLNPRTRDAVEILNGLIRINNDRIKFYKEFLEYGNDLDADYREFFALVAGESYQNNIWISIEIQTIEGNIETETPVDDVYTNLKPATPLPGRAVIVKQCVLVENTIRAEYAKAIQSVFIPQYMRELLKKQIRRLEAAKRQVERFS
ncbi:MAG: hypothetical protein EOO68_01175 [Moraxellaceae bacterium]|nr:MAG: hypothetical protein EOO68_01175 [Moraxellaceae bacterium]